MSFPRKMYGENIVPTKWDDTDCSHLVKWAEAYATTEGLWSGRQRLHSFLPLHLNRLLKILHVWSYSP